MSYADDLLQQARALAAIDPRRPKQASLRRAISAAYYAIFHELVDRAVGALLSGSDAAGPIGNRLRRVADHRAALRAARWFAGAPESMPQAIRGVRAASGASAPRVESALVLVCEALVNLQEKRHTADYDLGTAFTRDEAQRLIGDAEAAVAALRGLAVKGDALVFLLGCLFGDALTRNP